MVKTAGFTSPYRGTPYLCGSHASGTAACMFRTAGVASPQRGAPQPVWVACILFGGAHPSTIAWKADVSLFCRKYVGGFSSVSITCAASAAREGVRRPAPTHGARGEQCAECEVHGVGVHLGWGLSVTLTIDGACAPERAAPRRTAAAVSCATHGARTQQCTSWEAHGVGVHHVFSAGALLVERGGAPGLGDEALARQVVIPHVEHLGERGTGGGTV